MNQVTIPKNLMPLIKAFSADDTSAKLLIQEAAKAIRSANPKSYGDTPEFTKDELEGIIALMRGIAPTDSLEAIYAAQIVSSHLMGLRLLSNDFQADQVLGLKLLRFSGEAMTHLLKKRSGGSQNITITYNNAGCGPAVMQTIIPGEQCQ